MIVGLLALVMAQTSNGVPGAILERLHSGVNVTRWLGYVNAKDQAHMKGYLKDEDYANFKRLGIQYVRLCVSPEVMYDAGKPNATNLPLLDAALQSLTSHKLAVFLDLHDNGQMKLDVPGHENGGFVGFWQAMARHYREQREGDIVFELLNEPQFLKNPEVWYALQEQAVKAIREIDPKRTILAVSTGWNGIDTMAKMPLLAEKNVIYSCHCYDPFYFTHQGASWVGPEPREFKSVPFPASPGAVAAILDQNPQHRQPLIDYGKTGYDSTYLRSRMKVAADWGRKNGVPIVLGEFGAYPPVSPPDSRARWFVAMKEAMTAERLPYCLWGYDDALGLGRRVDGDGSIWLDPVVLKSLYGAASR